MLLVPIAIGSGRYAPHGMFAVAFAAVMAGGLGRALFRQQRSIWGAAGRGALISLLTLAATNLVYWELLYLSTGERATEALLIAAIGTALFSWFALIFGITAGVIARRPSGPMPRVADRTTHSTAERPPAIRMDATST
jgi:hypothetical protein